MNTLSISANFAESLVYSYAGGINELDVGCACTSHEAAAGLKAKIDAQLEAWEEGQRDITLFLTDDEAMCLAVASQNCATNGLPASQQAKLDEWFERWKRSQFAPQGSWEFEKP